MYRSSFDGLNKYTAAANPALIRSDGASRFKERNLNRDPRGLHVA